MTEITKQTVTRKDNNNRIVETPVIKEATNLQTMQYLIYFLFGVLDVLLAFRLVFKLLGASQASAFVRFIYSVTGIFILPFEGIFHKAVAEGIETASILEPSTIFAIIVYAFLAWGTVKLMQILAGRQEE